MRMCLLVCLLAFAGVGDLASTEVASGDNGEQAIQKVLVDFRDAWNRHDMRAYADLCADTADFIVISGRHLKGRAEIFEYHNALHKGAFKDRRLAARWKDVRFLRPDVALGHVAFEGTSSSSGDDRGTTNALATVVLAKNDGRWLIAAFHNTLLVGQVPGVWVPSDPK